MADSSDVFSLLMDSVSFLESIGWVDAKDLFSNAEYVGYEDGFYDYKDHHIYFLNPSCKDLGSLGLFFKDLSLCEVWVYALDDFQGIQFWFDLDSRFHSRYDTVLTFSIVREEMVWRVLA